MTLATKALSTHTIYLCELRSKPRSNGCLITINCYFWFYQRSLGTITSITVYKSRTERVFDVCTRSRTTDSSVFIIIMTMIITVWRRGYTNVRDCGVVRPRPELRPGQGEGCVKIKGFSTVTAFKVQGVFVFIAYSPCSLLSFIRPFLAVFSREQRPNCVSFLTISLLYDSYGFKTRAYRSANNLFERR